MKKKTLILILLLITFIFAQEWVARYNGPGNGGDSAKAIAVDNNGNVYVTGRSEGDYATIKYNSNGQVVWIARYNGPGNGWDEARAIAVDNNGNVYVTGASCGVTSPDYATIKYNANGQELWVARYGAGYDEATAIAVDNNGNVYVTGWSYNYGTSHEDYVTIKYNSNGQELWVARYNYDNDDDEATAIAVDNNGNVYVTGYSWGQGTSYDYATIKYNANGEQLWVRRYNGPGNLYDFATAIAVDNNGNVYVTGRSYVGPYYDYATIKYNSNGQQLWVARYNGPGNNSDDWATAIAVDNNGNVYVTGYSWVTSPDYATIKYNANGQELWVARYNGPSISSYDYANAIAVDNNGNVYVTGRSYGYSTYYDYATIKYNANGQELWVARYNGPGNDYDEATAIAVDNNGNVYVTGYSYGQGTNYDYATIKYREVGIEEKENKPISKSNLPKENLKIYNIIGKPVNFSKNLKPGIYFIETKEKSKRKIVIVR